MAWILNSKNDDKTCMPSRLDMNFKNGVLTIFMLKMQKQT